MAPKEKKGSRHKQKPMFSASNGNAKPIGSTPPSPFSKPPPKLEPFIEKLDKKHIYITTLDTNPADFKKKVFIVPILTNTILVCIILYRIWNVVPYYWAMAAAAPELTKDDWNVPNIMERFFNFALDYFLYAVILPWPREFLLGRNINTALTTEEKANRGAYSSPVTWRMTVPFQDIEVTVRKSKTWDLACIMPGYDLVTDADSVQREVFDEAVSKALSAESMGGVSGGKARTGYALMDREWELDWSLMTAAHTVVETSADVDEKEVVHGAEHWKAQQKIETFRAFEGKVFVHSEAHGWVVWDAAAEVGTVDQEAERERIVKFKDTWMRMGREGMFFKWIEVVQESGVVEWEEAERKKELRSRARRMIESEGLDFEDTLEKIGGWKNWPGLE